MGRVGYADLLTVQFGVRQHMVYHFSSRTSGLCWAVSLSGKWTVQLLGNRIVLRVEGGDASCWAAEEKPWQV